MMMINSASTSSSSTSSSSSSSALNINGGGDRRNSSGSSESYEQPYKIQKLEIEDPIKFKFLKYIDHFTSAVRSGEFVWQEKLPNPPWFSFGIEVIETGKLLKFPLQAEEVRIDELAASEFKIMNEDWSEYLNSAVLLSVRAGFDLWRNIIGMSLQKLIIQKPGNVFPNLELFNPTANDNGDGDSISHQKLECIGHLVIQLPSHYTGGRFRFIHEEKVKEFDMSASMLTKDGWGAQFFAFYKGIEQHHEEILTGIRSCLIYKLELELNPESEIQLPMAPTLKNVIPSIFHIIQEWKGNAKYPKVLQLTCCNDSVKPAVISSFLAPLLRDNGISLFYGKKDELDYGDSVHFISRLKVLSNVDIQVEEAFAKFLQGEPANPDGYEAEDDVGLEFDLKPGQIERHANFGANMFLFFLSDDACSVDVFENEGWFRSREFWRFKSYLFLTKYGDEKALNKEVLLAAHALVSLETAEEDYEEDLFPCLQHFENLLKKFIELDDTELLDKFLRISQSKSDFKRVFPVMLKYPIGWPSLKSVLQHRLAPEEVQDGNDLLNKIRDFESHVRTFSFVDDKNREQFYLDLLQSILREFVTLMKMGSIVDDHQSYVMMDLFSISEVLQYNLFQFMKSNPSPFVRKTLYVSSMRERTLVRGKLGKIWVRLVADIYCCSDLVHDWAPYNFQDEQQDCNEPNEAEFLTNYFKIAERARADIQGMLGDTKKQSLIVKSLARIVDIDGDTVAAKFWIPFATRLQSRIEAVHGYPDISQSPEESDMTITNDLPTSEDEGNSGIALLKEMKRLVECLKKSKVQ